MPSLDVAINALRAEAGAKKFDRSVKKIQKGAGHVDRSIKSNQANMNKFGTTIGKVAVGMIGMAAAYKGIRLAQSAVREFAMFEQQLANVSTMLDEQTMNFLPLYKKELRNLSVEFGQTTETLSKGLYDILSASVGAADALDVLEVASKAAIGGLTTTAVAADAITTVMNAYGMEAKDAEKISDILFSTVKAGKITFGELGSSIGKVVAIASVAGLELEEVAAAIATMTRNGIKSDMAMTSLKAIITGFTSPTKDAQLAAHEFNLTLNTATLQTIGLTGALELLQTATAEEMNAIFPNVRALLGAAAATKSLVAMKGDLANIIGNTGSMMEAFGKNVDTSTVALKQTKEMWNALKAEFGEGIAPALNAVMSDLRFFANEWRSTWSDVSEAQKEYQEEIDKRMGDWKFLKRIPAIWLLDKAMQKVVGSAGEMADEVARVNEALDPKTIAAFNAEILKTNDTFMKISGMTPADLTGPLNLDEQLRRIGESVNTMGSFKPTVDVTATTTPPSTEEEKATAAERAEAARRMFDDMDSRSKASYENRLLLLDQELAAYQEFVTDEALLDDWYHERKAALDADRVIAGQDFQAGFTTNLGIMQQDMMTLGEIGAQSAEQMKSAFGTATKSMIMNGATLKEAMHGFAMSMLSNFIDVITEMIAMQMMAMAFGISPPSGGGFVGPPSPFKNAKGNVFTAGVTAFRDGGLIGKPTIFPMANGGVGLAGEAGTEAIMPLGRDGQGRLGVRGAGSDDSKQGIQIVNVVDESMMEEYLNTGSGERAVMNIMNRNREGGSESFV